MKKLLLVLLLVASLNAVEALCADSLARWNKYTILNIMAAERKDMDRVYFTNYRKIYYVELAIADCAGLRPPDAIEMLKNARKKYISFKENQDEL